MKKQNFPLEIVCMRGVGAYLERNVFKYHNFELTFIKLETFSETDKFVELFLFIRPFAFYVTRLFNSIFNKKCSIKYNLIIF